MSAASDGEKEYEPTQKRLDEAFDSGNFPKSADLLGAISISLTGLFGFFYSGPISNSVSYLSLAYGYPERSGGYSINHFIYDVIIVSVYAVAVPFIFTFFYSLFLCRFRISLSKLMLKMDRMSLVAGFKNKFGFRAIKNAFGMISKLAVIAIVVYLSLSKFYEVICIQCFGGYSENIIGLISLLGVLVSVYLVLGVLDYFFRVTWWRSDLKMSRAEFVKEQKEQEGDVMLKSQRRRLAVDMLGAGGSVAAVAKADVIIVNPTHYAVAISWRRDSNNPPIVMAKGVDQMALQMREHALRNGIPQYRDPITARSIYSTVKVGKTIERRHYHAVASAIRFSSMINKSKK